MKKDLHLAIPVLGTDHGQSGIGHYVRHVIPVIARTLEQSGGRITILANRREVEAYREALSCSPIISVRTVPDLPPALEAAYHLVQVGRVAKEVGANCLLLLAGNRRLVVQSSMPCVAVVHDLAQLEVSGKYDAFRMLYVSRVLCKLLARVTRLVAVSGTTRERMVDALGLQNEDVRVIHNGIDHNRFQVAPSPMAPPISPEIVAGGPYVLYSSRLEHPGKNHERLLRAFAASALRTDHQLVFAGKDWGAQAHLEKVVLELGLGEKVRFLGYVPDDVLPVLVRNASAVAMVGLCEGFGLPAVEALACGTPLLASNTGALPEVTGGLAELCDPLSVDSIRDALERVVHLDEIRIRAREQGPTWASQFSWDRAGTSLVDVCREAVA
jgi:glycosyltransferase involved in cell wall biosynthesis